MTDVDQGECTGTWSHRVVLRDYGAETLLEIHEVHYDGGKPTALTQDPTWPSGESLADLRWALERMLACLDYPVLGYDTMAEVPADVADLACALGPAAATERAAARTPEVAP